MNRHVEALAEEFLGRGHDVRVLAPFDPPGRVSRVLHRAAAEPREMPDYLTPLGRTIGLRRQRLRLQPRRRSRPAGSWRRAARCARGEFDVIHVHEPLAPLVGWNATLGARTPVVGTFHAYSTKPVPNYIANAARRPPHVQPPLGPDRRLRGGRLDRAALVRRRLHDHPQRGRRRRRAERAAAAGGGAAHPLRRPPGGAQGAADPADRLRRPGRARPLPPDRDRRRARGRAPLPRRPRAAALDRHPRPGLRREPLGGAARRRRALRAVALRRELRHGPDRGLRRRHAGDRLHHRRLQRRRHRRRRRPAGPARRPAAPGRGAAAGPPRARAPARRWGRPPAAAPSATPGRGSPTR